MYKGHLFQVIGLKETVKENFAEIKGPLSSLQSAAWKVTDFNAATSANAHEDITKTKSFLGTVEGYV